MTVDQKEGGGGLLVDFLSYFTSQHASLSRTEPGFHS